MSVVTEGIPAIIASAWTMPKDSDIDGRANTSIEA